jgi:hypothetical protein
MADRPEFGIQSSVSPTLPSAADTPQFSTAEYSHVAGTERCRICNNLIGGDYFRVNGLMACAQCASDARNGQPRDSHSAFSRGLILGIGAAVLGMIVYAAFTIITGWYIGYLALGVGYLVAKAIKKGSNGLGGRRYQIAAVVLTYAAISIAAVPIGISYAIKDSKSASTRQEGNATQPGTDANPENASPAAAAPATKDSPNYGALAGQLLLLGLASPFMELQDPLHGIIGLLILFIGLRIAWRLTASQPLDVEGPYSHSAAGSIRSLG